MFLRRRSTKFDDRRSSRRYSVEKIEAELCWHDGEQHRTCSATILNLSLGGTLLLAEALPPVSETVWFRLQDEEVPEWDEAVALQARRVGSGGYLIRLKFSVHCPYDVFKRVVFQNDLRGCPERIAPDVEEWVWR